MNRLKYYTPGGLVIGAGLLILAFPEILVAIVAALIVLIGVLGLYMGHRIRKADEEAKDPEGGDAYSWRFSRIVPGKRWYGDF